MEIVLGGERKTEPEENEYYFITYTREILRSPGQIWGPSGLRGISIIVVKMKKSNDNVHKKKEYLSLNCSTDRRHTSDIYYVGIKNVCYEK